MSGYTLVENTTDLRTGHYGSSFGGYTIAQGLAFILKAQRSKSCTILSDSVNESGYRVVEYCRKHPLDRSRITLVVA